MTKQIALSRRGKYKGQHFAIVDDEDLEHIDRYRWCVAQTPDGRRYAVRRENKKIIFMHRQIMNPPKGLQIDHVNGDGCDNRRSNLRICTPRQNQGNSKLNKTNKSGYKGVSWHARSRKWQVSIKYDGKIRNLGYFPDPISAALAYDAAARKHFGEFARTNFPQEAI